MDVVDNACDQTEPVRPFELLSLTEAELTSTTTTTTTTTAISTLDATVSSDFSSATTTTTTVVIPDFGVISQSVNLLSTGSSLDDAISTVIDMGEHCNGGSNASVVTPLLTVVQSLSSLSDFCLDEPATNVPPAISNSQSIPPLESFIQFCQLAEKTTLENLQTRPPGSAAGEESAPNRETPGGNTVLPFIHRSVSSPIFGSSTRNLTADSETDSRDSSIISGKSEKKSKRRKTLIACFPEAEPPAVRPRFQWYQAKGVVRIHIMVKNLLPKDFSLMCNGRDLVFRCKADGSPYPPTRPETTPRPMIEYHLPLRLPHRIWPEPEFSRISPTLVEMYFRKVKPLVVWSRLWKNSSQGRCGAWGDLDPETVSSSGSDEDDEDDESDDENDQGRPAKRFMNGPDTAADSKRVAAPLGAITTEENVANSAIFTVGPGNVGENGVDNVAEIGDSSQALVENGLD
ncbi:hypothetical protein BV898_00455 [Hypsibius exemplaris]|uniref:CS domain-containing protein n=1 Tax=Hypsibius exemplaris TaxID=2072580 RepID=A0A1W0XDG2_HYPEX|nr:hypothetical protein BV898_00455 [Hypsibius exemplaris]